jgi:hypothetical protein
LDGELVTVRPLGDRDVWGEQRQVQVVPPVVGQALHHLLVQSGGRLDLAHVDQRLLGGRNQLLELNGLTGKRKVERHGSAEPHLDPGPAGGAVAQRPGRHVVVADRKETGDIDPLGVGGDGEPEVGGRIQEHHFGARQRPAGRVGHNAADHTRRRLGLGMEPGRKRDEGRGAEERQAGEDES